MVLQGESHEILDVWCLEEEKLLEILLPSSAHAFLWLGLRLACEPVILERAIDRPH